MTHDWDAIYTVLVEEAGAPESQRDMFLHCETEDSGCREYRFGGKLGFGGKFWVNSRNIYVNCYREDEEWYPEMTEVISRTNARLASLKEKS